MPRRHERADRYRLEAKYLRSLIDTFAEGAERQALLKIAEAYEQLANRITNSPPHLIDPAA